MNKPILLNETFIEKMDKQNALLSMMVNEHITESANWNEIGEIVRKGLASDVFSIGDQLVTKWTDTASGTEYTCPMDIVHFGEVELEDGEKVPAMFLQWHYCTPFGVQFDAPEPTNADASIQQYGYNRWSQSALRQFLNSKADKGEWWTAQSDTDVAPNEHSTKNGFLSGFHDDFLAQIKPIKILTQTNTVTDGGITDTTYDTFFLPSKRNMNLIEQATIEEGDIWEYWYRATNGQKPANYVDGAAPLTYAINAKTSPLDVRLRSAHRSNSCYTWYVNSAGYVTNYRARYAYRFAPACAIC